MCIRDRVRTYIEYLEHKPDIDTVFHEFGVATDGDLGPEEIFLLLAQWNLGVEPTEKEMEYVSSPRPANCPGEKRAHVQPACAGEAAPPAQPGSTTPCLVGPRHAFVRPACAGGQRRRRAPGAAGDTSVRLRGSKPWGALRFAWPGSAGRRTEATADTARRPSARLG